ncbi:MAG TPA: signal peptidase II [Thermoguttaceae bacterium]|nr:signal peptidase II [Thermoguttaceae bacterium]
MRAVPANRYFVFFSIAIAGCALDLATKSWAFGRLGAIAGPPMWLWPDVFGFQTNLNEGALFGMGQRMVAMFVGLSLLAAVGIQSWLFIAGAARDWLLTVALGCVTAGIFGNLYDRLGFPGLTWPAGHPHHAAGETVYAVRDWILVMIGDWPWPTFNIADSFLVCGAIMLIGHAIWIQPKNDQKAAQEMPSGDA